MLLVNVIFVLTLFSCIAAQNEGEICSMASGEGICKSIYDCPSAIKLLKEKIRPPTCTFKNNIPIVCCETEIPTTSKRPVGQISKQKCEEYGKTMFQIIRPPIFLAEQVNVSLCGQTNIPLIIGGTKASGAEFPHQALLGYGQGKGISWQCGGTLISENYVLTAAHCLVNGEKQTVSTVRLGELDYATRFEEGADPQDFKVVETIPHPARKLPLRYHDIALIKLDRPATINKFIRPACLHTEFRIPPTNNQSSIPRFIATGWGVTAERIQSTHLLKVVLDSFSQQDCSYTFRNSKRFLNIGIDENSQVCAGGTDEEKDTCQGDSGGPLQIYNQDVYCMYSIIGITSFGKECGVQSVPAVYTRVSNYIEWIEDTVWPQ